MEAKGEEANSMDRCIDLAIIGAQKAGTTSLYHYLAQHPDLFLPFHKEMGFFGFDEEYFGGEAMLDAYFHGLGNQPLVGFAWAHAMYLPQVCDRLFHRNPQMKLIACLRNPVDRAYSAWWFAVQRGTETLGFEEALQEEDRRASGSWREQVQLTYKRHGYYHEQLERYTNRFGRDRLFVALNEDLKESPEATVKVILRWIGLDPADRRFSFEHHNVASTPRVGWLHHWIADESRPAKRLARRLIPPRVRLAFREHVTEKVVDWNLQPVKVPPMAPETRRVLADHFAAHNEALATFLGRDLSHWQ